METVVRRAAITNIDLADVNLAEKTITVLEKGGHRHPYQISLLVVIL